MRKVDLRFRRSGVKGQKYLIFEGLSLWMSFWILRVVNLENRRSGVKGQNSDLVLLDDRPHWRPSTLEIFACFCWSGKRTNQIPKFSLDTGPNETLGFNGKAIRIAFI